MKKKIMILTLMLILLVKHPLMIYLISIYLLKEFIDYLYNKKISIQSKKSLYTLTILGIIALCLPLNNMITGIIIQILIIAYIYSICLNFYRFMTRYFHMHKIPLSKGIFNTIVILIIVGCGIIPYAYQPTISEEYKSNFHTNDYYQPIAHDRAAILEDNEDALKERIRAISHAKRSIIMSTFDFRCDNSGKQMMSALYEASLKGIKIKLIIDGFNGVLRLENEPYMYYLASLKNIEVKLYNPISIIQSYKGMSRMHDKYIIIDNDLYILGGRNTFDYFLGNETSYKNYDRDVLVYNNKNESKKSIFQVKSYFNKVWNSDLSKKFNINVYDKIPHITNIPSQLKAIYSNMKEKHSDWFHDINYSSITVQTDNIQLLSNPTGLYSKEPTVFYSMTQLIKNSNSATIHTPYIICNGMMYDSLKEMCSSCDVTLMTNSALNNGNPFGAMDYAFNKKKLLSTGLHVLEYNGGVSYHGKSVTIDDDLSIVGSFNMDMKSVYQDTELMLVIHSKDFNSLLKQHFHHYHKDALQANRTNDIISLIKKDPLYIILMILDPFIRYLF